MIFAGPDLERAAHWAELIGGISGTLASMGVFAMLRRMWKLGRAVSHVPDMLHGHPETKGPVMAENIDYPFRETHSQAKAGD